METKTFKDFEKIVEQLRDPENGCPWDLKQTHKSLLKYLIEESYEFIHSVEEEDFSHMEEELGDILLQVFLHSQLAKEKGHFSIDSVVHKITEKMIRRHPHVFDKKDKEISSDQVVENWEKIKEEEKSNKEEVPHQMDDAYLHLPALFSAQKIGKKTNKVGFDWEDPQQVSYKVEEEWQELKEELASSQINKEFVEEELGDFLFSGAQLARHLGIDPENALRKANKKFLTRYNLMVKLIADKGLNLTDLTQREMDVYWEIAKEELKKS